ncbi:Mbeg1-like protein, partial [Campylobacter troglodytis]|uniref:Mbeg1-like protein n=1 Tax=Campylobacter troglodytis TaxID=654363 RepID=UPI00115A7C1E
MIAKLDDLKNYAELAQASYFYFDLDGYVLKENNITITLNEIISSNYNGKTAGKKIKIGHEYYLTDTRELNGEFGELQAKEFIKRYKIYFHQANTASGFSATLFYDTQKDRFVLGFRGTEGFWNIDAIQDIALSLSMNIQHSALLDFLKEVKQILQSYKKPIIFVGHSLGGYLAQWALIYCDDKYKDLLGFSPKEVYTFNSPSIYGWNFPNTIINPNTMKILREVFDKLSIDTSMKLTHIYNSSGIKLIASAQYGSQNTLPIYTSLNSHSIITLTQTLYFYSYLLELKGNYNKIAQNNTSQDTINN